MPDKTQPDTEKSRFDQFAERAAHFYGRSAAFIGAMIIVLAWAALGPIMQFKDTWHLIINTPTTIVTFFGVFLIQNAAWRDSRAMNKKLDAIADALADFMSAEGPNMDQHVTDLKAAVGLEQREGS